MVTVLGRATWAGPDRQRSINSSLSATMRRGFFNWHKRTAYGIMEPALSPAVKAYEAVDRLIASREEDFWYGESIQPGCAMDIAMHGHNTDDAQPAIIYSSASGRCRQNAKSIIEQEGIVVDRRGIDLEFYPHGVIFYAAPSSRAMDSRPGTETRPSSASEKRLTFSQGVLIDNGSRKCTIGGTVMVGTRMCSLTVAHASEGDDSIPLSQSFDIISQDSSILVKNAGTISRRRARHKKNGSKNCDWALCELDERRAAVINQAVLGDGTICCPSRIATDLSGGQAVIVSTGPHGLVKGKVMSTYSMVALPGSTSFQRMCSIVLERPIGVGASGAWVFDATTGDLCGHIVAGNPTTTLAYIIPAQQVFDDIANETGEVVTLPTLDDFDPIPEEVIRPVSHLNSPGQVELLCAKAHATWQMLYRKFCTTVYVFLFLLFLVSPFVFEAFFTRTPVSVSTSTYGSQKFFNNGWLASSLGDEPSSIYLAMQPDGDFWNRTLWSKNPWSDEKHVAWTEQPPGRGTLDVIWSSALTIVVCSWSAMYINIPRPGDDPWTRSLNKIVFMFLAIFVPEFVLMSAWYQYTEAHSLAKSVRDSLGDAGAVPVSALTSIWRSLTRPFRRTKRRRRSWSVDRGSGTNSTGVTIPTWEKKNARPHWTMSQCHYSVMGGYAVSFEPDAVNYVLEPASRYQKLTTLPASIVWYLFITDWDHFKPHFLPNGAIRDRSKVSGLTQALVALQIMWTWFSCWARIMQNLPLTTLEISTLVHTVLVVITLFFWKDKPFDVQVPTIILSRDLSPSAQAYIRSQVLNAPTNSLSIWDRIIGLTSFDSASDTREPWMTSWMTSWKLLLIMVIYGFTSLLNLYTVLPSSAERLLWRLSVASMVVIWAISLLQPAKVARAFATATTTLSPEKINWREMIPWFSLMVGYSVVRAYMLVQSAIELRSVPDSVYRTSDWTMYIPHI